MKKDILPHLIILSIAWIPASVLAFYIQHKAMTGQFTPSFIIILDFIVLGIMTVIVFLTIFYEIWRVARINPAEVVKSE